jgi:hypothetical protein
MELFNKFGKFCKNIIIVKNPTSAILVFRGIYGIVVIENGVVCKRYGTEAFIRDHRVTHKIIYEA